MKPLRLLAVIEASTVTGPAKNLLQYATIARSLPDPVEVNIAVFHRPGDPRIFLDAASSAGIPAHLIEERGRFDRTVVSALGELRRKLQPDLIQTHAVKSHLLARLAGLRPWIAFHHGYTWPDLRARIYNQADRWSLRKAAQVLTVSEPFALELSRMGVRRERIEVIHNAIDPEWGRREGQRDAAALRASLGIAPDSKIVLIVGRLSKEKDHRTLLDALAALPECVHLLIVGDGPEREPIQRQIAHAGLQGRVTMTGQVPSAEPYYAAACIAVLSSLSEGSPNALLEAMAAGVPVVATRVGGIPEIAEDGHSALLVAPGDRSAMATAIRRLLDEPDLAARLAARATVLIQNRFSPIQRTMRLGAIYRNLLE